MKTSIKLLGLLLGAAFLGSCQNHFDDFDGVAPQATLQPNMTILELKEMYWDDATNYIDTIGVRRDTIYNEDGSVKEIQYPRDDKNNRLFDDKEYIIAGRVISSDEAGNVFKSLVIQDKTAALALSINSYNLYLKYRMGQEIVINLKGMYIGKYNGLLQLGMPEFYEAGNAWEATFMAPEFFEQHIELNGWPEAAKIDTLEINDFSELPSNPEGYWKYQSQLVKFNNVYFQNGGKEQFSEYHSSGVNQNIVDVNGNSLPVRTSGYSNFWNNYLPEGNGDVVCILSFYGTTGWQLILNDYQGCMNFGSEAVGTETNPYTVEAAIDLINKEKVRKGWVEGYIVGAVAPEVKKVTSNNDVEWSSDVVLNNTLVIGATADTKDIKQALVIELPDESMLRKYGNLEHNPSNYKKKIAVYGTFGMVMDTYGVLDNNGAASLFKIEGVEVDDGSAKDGDGTEASPYNVGQVIAKKPTSTTDAVQSGVWVCGYIVGSMPTGGSSTTLSGAVFGTNDAAKSNIVLGPTPDCKSYAQCISIQLPNNDIRTALSLATKPEMLGKFVWLKGDIMKYCGGPGLKNLTAYKVDGTTPDTPVTPPAGSALYSEAFSNTQGDFIINNVNLPSGLSYVWNATEQYGMKASAFANSTTYAAESWLISPVFNLAKASGVSLNFDQANNKYASVSDIATQATVWVSVDGGAWKQLSVPNYGSNADWNFVNSGDIDLSAYSGKKISIGFKYLSTSASAGTWEVKNFALKGSGSITTSEAIIPGGGSTTPDTPDTPVNQNSADFNTLNGGVPNSVSYSTYKTASGWVAEWSQVLAGGATSTSFVSDNASFLFPCIDGTVERPGKLTSPTIKGGLKSLKFNYGFPYQETKVGFTVNIKQGGTVVATNKVLADPAAKATVYVFDHEYNVSGDFVIEIVNDLVTNTASGNKDRIAIWNLTWSN